MTEFRDIVGPADVNKGTDIKVYDTLSDRPTAATFGVGQCQIGEAVYVSDGATWKNVTTIIQAAKSADFTLSADDDNTQIPISATLTVTLNSGLATDFVTKLQNLGANTLTLSAGSGVTLWVSGASVASTTLTAKGSAMVIECSGTADEFFIYKAGS